MNSSNSDETEFTDETIETKSFDSELAASETVDIAPAKKMDSAKIKALDKKSHSELDRFIAHLADACPLISYEEKEAKENMARYIMGKRLGSGAIGQVIEATDEHLGRNVAIKILQDNNGIDRDRIARFIAEAQIIAQLEHPTIVPVHEIGRMPGGLPYFTMKQVKGQLLSEVINDMRVNNEKKDMRRYTTRLLRRFSSLCNGIAYAHSKGVVHRDLKPDNIMIGEYGEIQIMDWGLAKVMSENEVRSTSDICTVRSSKAMSTLDGSIAGTPSYMSPEQARGELDKITPASDIFSLGLLLAEIITLVRVFRCQESSVTLRQVGRAGPIDIAELNRKVNVPKEIQAIIRKCTMPDPKDRYQSAEDLSDDIKAYMENRGVTAMPDNQYDKIRKWTMRHQMSAGLIIGTIATLIIGTVVHSIIKLLN